MTEDERAALVARLDAIDKKLDQVLEFRDQVIEFVTAGLTKKAMAAVKTKIRG